MPKHNPKVEQTKEGYYVWCPCGYLSVIYADRAAATRDRDGHR